MRPRLVQEQTLQRKMNQSLLQAIQLLQYTSTELIDHIKKIAEENPLIEEITYSDDLSSYRTTHANNEHPEIGEINPTQYSMYDTLKNQLYTLNVPSELKPIVEYGIDSLNEDGYLDVDLDLWAENCNTTIKNVEDALFLIQSLEPTGIGARNLSECILLQLKETVIYEPFIENLLEEHLDWIANENINYMIDKYGVNEDQAFAIIEQIKLCHPKPGQLISTKESEYIIPEARIFEEDGVWKLAFYKWNAPTITINTTYEQLENVEKETATYLKEKYKQVKWLQQSIAYRTNTLELVIKKIVEKQQAYFERGPHMLKPLTLREIANELDFHISTISRTISNKYVQTDKGVIPLKFFMQSGIASGNGKQTSSFVVKKIIKELIQQEDKRRPLSDNIVSEKLLEEYNISIARRTVMKYRDELNIPSSMKRKQVKQQ